MTVAVRRGKTGWLEQNLASLLHLKERYPRHISVQPDKALTSFRISVTGKDRFSKAKLALRCDYPSPGFPPKFTLLNPRELSRLNHPHITDVYMCLKTHWRPGADLSAPMAAILKAWWRGSN